MNTEIIEKPLEENEFQLTEDYRVHVGAMNYTLSQKYQKRVGKGRSAELSNEYGYANEKYFGRLESLVTSLLDKEFTEYLGTAVSESEEKGLQNLIKLLEECKSHQDKVALEIKETLKDKVIINLEEKKKKQRTVRGQKIDEVDEDVEEVIEVKEEELTWDKVEDADDELQGAFQF